jgi:hypothetical protein
MILAHAEAGKNIKDAIWVMSRLILKNKAGNSEIEEKLVNLLRYLRSVKEILEDSLPSVGRKKIG